MIVHAEKLVKSYGDTVAVDGATLNIRRGEIFGLLGPNGAGKTTTIKILSTILTPDSGEARIGGCSVTTQAREVRKMIGLCPQEIALYEELSALDNVVFFARMAGLTASEASKRARECLTRMGLWERARGKVSAFSGGMKRRVNLAVSLASEPELLFLDEPTVGVDAQSRARIYDTVRSLRDEGMTVLYTTHYMEEADSLCDRIAVMDYGAIIAEGSPRQLKALLPDEDHPTLEDVFLHLTGRTLRD